MISYTGDAGSCVRDPRERPRRARPPCSAQVRCVRSSGPIGPTRRKPKFMAAERTRAARENPNEPDACRRSYRPHEQTDGTCARTNPSRGRFQTNPRPVALLRFRRYASNEPWAGINCNGALAQEASGIRASSGRTNPGGLAIASRPERGGHGEIGGCLSRLDLGGASRHLQAGAIGQAEGGWPRKT
jgi:hypothetical protein